MIVKVLGSSAGGAFPQWNCACANCSHARRGGFPGARRTQSQVAVSLDGRAWHLLNASPDLARQIEATPELHPRPEDGPRNTPIRSVTLTNADLDHVLGLLLLREAQPLRVFCTRPVERILLEDNSFFGMLRQNPEQVRWEAIVPDEPFELRSHSGEGSGIRATPVPLSGRYPRYVGPARASELGGVGAVMGLVLQARAGGPKLGYFPGVGEITPRLAELLSTCALVLVDGTFWSDEEMIRSGTGVKTAAEMNHCPVPLTMEKLSGPALAGVRKVFVHINNTNPMLDESGPENARVRRQGWELAFDGAEYRLE